MQVRPITGIPRPSYRVVRRIALGVLRWTFITIGAGAIILDELLHAKKADR